MQIANDNLSPAADLLIGAAAVAHFLGFKRRTIYHLAATGGIPTFRAGDIVCGRRSTLIAWMAGQEAAQCRPRRAA